MNYGVQRKIAVYQIIVNQIIQSMTVNESREHLQPSSLTFPPFPLPVSNYLQVCVYWQLYSLAKLKLISKFFIVDSAGCTIPVADFVVLLTVFS